MANDYISRQAAIDKLEHDPIGKLIIDKYNVRGWLEGLPAADVVEVVRCLYCKYYNGETCKNNQLPYWELSDLTDVFLDPKPDDFCSYGERRVND